MLSKALASLEKLQLPAEYKVACFLCDNDPDKSAEPIFQNFTNKLPFPIKYFYEKDRGIVPARNRLLHEAGEVGAAYLAFFDDDEQVHSDWLKNLVATAISYQAEAVSGQVRYSLPDNCPEWLKKRNFYGGERPKTGTVVKSASTNNVLVNLDFLKKHDLRFNMIFSMSGGSDSYFFQELRESGGIIISCREAIAFESVPESRATEEWILNRAFKNGYTEIKRSLVRRGRIHAILVFIIYGLWLRLCNLFGHLGYPFLDYSYKVFNRRRPKKIKGMLHSINRKEYEEYRTIHGS